MQIFPGTIGEIAASYRRGPFISFQCLGSLCCVPHRPLIVQSVTLLPL